MSASREAKTTRVTFTVEADDMAELEAIAIQQRVSVAWVIRDCIKKYLADRATLFGKTQNDRSGRGDVQ